jgi:peptide deformylase
VAVRSILLYPDPILKQVCEPVNPRSAAGRAIARDLAETLYAGRGVGLAAPQIGEPYRVILVDAGRNPRREGQGRFLLFNPVVVERDGQQVAREGCLSIPEYTGNVLRAAVIVLTGLDERGRPCRLTARDYEAVVFQHELDHLDGILFLDRIASVKTDLIRRKPRPGIPPPPDPPPVDPALAFPALYEPASTT